MSRLVAEPKNRSKETSVLPGSPPLPTGIARGFLGPLLGRAPAPALDHAETPFGANAREGFVSPFGGLRQRAWRSNASTSKTSQTSPPSSHSPWVPLGLRPSQSLQRELTEPKPGCPETPPPQGSALLGPLQPTQTPCPGSVPAPAPVTGRDFPGRPRKDINFSLRG